MGILDVIGGLATGAGQGIETGLSIKQYQEDRERQAAEDRRQAVWDAMERKLNEARLEDYRFRRTQAQDTSQKAEEQAARDLQDKEIRVAEFLHTRPDLQERYGTDFRPGGGARAAIDEIDEIRGQEAALQEQKLQMEKFPEQFQREPTAQRAPTDAQKFTAIARRAAEITAADPEITPAQAYAQASREYTQSSGGTVEPTEVEVGQQRIQQIQQGEYDWTAEDVQAAAADVQSGEITLMELKEQLGVSGSGNRLRGDEADIAFYLEVARHSNPAR